MSIRSNLLQSNLTLASVAVALVAVLLWWQADLSRDDFWLTVASACVSIVGALLITEVLLKPVYARDLVQMTQMSARLSMLGVRDLREESTLNLDEMYGSQTNITVATAAPTSFFERHWPAIKRATQRERVHVRILLFDPLEASGSSVAVTIASKMESEWKSGSGAAKGGSLVIEGVRNQPPRLLATTDAQNLLVAGSMGDATDPLVLVVDRSQDRLVADHCHSQLTGIVGAPGESTPFYSGGKVPTDDAP